MVSPVLEVIVGVELEGFWKGKEGVGLPSVRVRTPLFAQDLVERYNKVVGHDALRADLLHGPHPGHYDSSDGMHKWIVAIDPAIGAFSLDNTDSIEGHALEFVSPKLTFGPDSMWRYEVGRHWATLLQIGEVEVDHMCATHVHISPKEKEVWSLEQLKRIAKAVIYFDDPFKVISAPTRRDHDLTQSNKRKNYLLKDLDFGACCERIEKCANNLDLINLIQSGGLKADEQTRDYAWNFENTDKKFAKWGSGNKPIGTIEFRGAPGVTKASHCLIWVELAVSFVQAAAQYDTKRVLEKEYMPNVRGLKHFILAAGVEKMNDKDLLEVVFDGHEDDELVWNTDEQMTDAFDEKIEELGL